MQSPKQNQTKLAATDPANLPTAVIHQSYGSFSLQDTKCYWAFETDSDAEIARMQHDDFSKASVKDALKHAVDGKLPMWEYGTRKLTQIESLKKVQVS